jgi:2-hydroxychromene-2-carboxylate isomerase
VDAGVGQPVFYYDLGNPECYLVAETIMTALPVIPEWEPVVEASLADGDARAPDPQLIARRVSELGLQPLRWPAGWRDGRGANTELAMLVATYAKRGGRAVAFSLAAFRQAFAGGRDLGDQDTLLIAAAACEMHPTAVLKGIGLRSTRTALDAAVARAQAAGVRSLPAIQVGDALFSGEQCVASAAAALGAAA